METKRRIYIYTESDGKSPVFEFIRRLDQKLQKKIESQLKQIQNPLFELQPPHVKAFRQSRHKGFYELRTRIRQAARIIFVVDSDGNIILLHGFVKNGNRTTERALEMARARRYALASDSATTKEFIFSSMEEHKNYEKKIKRIISILFFIVMMMSIFSLTVFAEGEDGAQDIFQAADSIIRNVYNKIAGISTVLAGLMSAVSVIGAKMSNNQHKVDQSWDWLKRIWIAWAVINGIGAFIAYITPLFSGYNVLPE